MTDTPDPPDRWPGLDALFERVLDTDPDERGALLADVAATDPELSGELERLLAAHDASSGFLEDPAPWLEGLATASEAAGEDLADPLVGALVGRFEVLGRIAEGGMGVVYRARDTRLGRLVALKLLNPPARELPEAAERLEREARAASTLDHPNICTIHEIGEAADGRLFIAMAYYAGETLHERLARGPLGGPELLEIAIAVGEGLARAHEAGIVHRDLKPGNVMLTADGGVKVLDFGIAKREGTSDLTGASVRIGTVAYMSPEQARGEPVDQRTDIWSLGVTLHRCATGKHPFAAPTDLATLDAILRADPPPLEAGPPGLGAVVGRALAKDPGDRYENMSDMVADLRSLARGESAAASHSAGRGVSAGPSWKWVTAAAGAAAILGGYALIARMGAPTGDGGGDPVLAIPQGPTIAVVPFESTGPDPELEYFAKGITEDLITSLGRFSDLFVLASAASAPYAGPAPDVAALGRELGAAYALVGTVQQHAAQVRVTVRLVDTSTRSPEWSQTFDRDLSAAGLFDVQDEITQRVAGTLGGSGGLFGRRLATAARRGRTESLDSYACVLRSYDYLVNHSPANHAVARDCLEEVVQVDSGYVDAWGWLAYAYAEESRHGWNRRDYDPLDRALATAERAVRLDPGNFMAHVGLAAAHFDRHEVDQFTDAAERAMALNPNDATWLAAFGGWLAEVGDWERGITILDKARLLNPSHPSWVYVDYALNEYRQGSYEDALAYALRINLPDYYRGLLLQVAAFGQMGRSEDAGAAYRRVLELRPDLVDEQSVRRDYRQYNHPDELLDHILDGMWKAGIWDR